ncbi:hypothetical protein HU200_026541 [Digitaria exilis]|uniref:Uncharacterized protein n=1 Tax=Digitaria exilis TaxID=1010633 RepID=A0A835EUF7_9POAL|nr:hypothetical protein HU200_026541 [Digitaria exilis]
MGNSLPCPCVRHHEANESSQGTAGGGAKRWRRKPKRQASRRNVRAARPGHVVPVLDMAAEDDGEEAWRLPERPAGYFGRDGGEVRRVKIVMRRKDVAELVARLEQRVHARAGRNAAMAEEGNVVNDGGRVTMSPCRDSWRPRLSIVPDVS